MKKSIIIGIALFVLQCFGYMTSEAQNTYSNSGRTVNTYYMDPKIPAEQQACLIGKKNITFSPMLLENKNSRLIWYELTVIPPGEHTYYIHYDSGHGRLNNMPITASFEAGKYYTFESNSTIVDSGTSKKERISVSIIEVTDNATIENAKRIIAGAKDFPVAPPQPRPASTVGKTNDYKPQAQPQAQPNINNSQKQKNEITCFNKVMTSKDYPTRAKYITSIENNDYLYRIASAYSNIDVRTSTDAINRISSDDILYKIASENGTLREAAAGKIKDESLLYKIAEKSSGTFYTKIAGGITNQQLLYQLIKNSKDENRCVWTLGKITDPDLLLKIVQEDDNFTMRKMAFNKLDSSSLERLASGGSNDDAMVIAAKIILNRTSWDKEFSNESMAHLGGVIGAATLVKDPQPASENIVSACHTYIRRGDVSRISELKNLLQRFGDIALAEDYLNCGNTALYDAGREWGDQHGYNVGWSSNGSHRVQWSDGK